MITIADGTRRGKLFVWPFVWHRTGTRRNPASFRVVPLVAKSLPRFLHLVKSLPQADNLPAKPRLTSPMVEGSGMGSVILWKARSAGACNPEANVLLPPFVVNS